MLTNHSNTFTRFTHVSGQAFGITTGIALALMWSFAMWGPTSVLKLSGTSFSGAFVMVILAIVGIVAALRAHGIMVLIAFVASFFPVGFYFISQPYWLRWVGFLNFGFLVAGLLLWLARKLATVQAKPILDPDL